jgi:hypothetical protein
VSLDLKGVISARSKECGPNEHKVLTGGDLIIKDIWLRLVPSLELTSEKREKVAGALWDAANAGYKFCEEIGGKAYGNPQPGTAT